MIYGVEKKNQNQKIEFNWIDKKSTSIYIRHFENIDFPTSR